MEDTLDIEWIKPPPNQKKFDEYRIAKLHYLYKIKYWVILIFNRHKSGNDCWDESLKKELKAAIVDLKKNGWDTTYDEMKSYILSFVPCRKDPQDFYLGTLRKLIDLETEYELLLRTDKNTIQFSLSDITKDKKELIYNTLKYITANQDFKPCTSMVSLFEVKQKDIRVLDNKVKIDTYEDDSADFSYNLNDGEVAYCASETNIIRKRLDVKKECVFINRKLSWAIENKKKVLFIVAADYNKIYQGNHATMFIVFPNYTIRTKKQNQKTPYLITSLGLGPSDEKTAEISSPDQYSIPKPFVSDFLRLLFYKPKVNGKCEDVRCVANSGSYKIIDMGQLRKGHLSRILAWIEKTSTKKSEVELYTHDENIQENDLDNGTYMLRCVNIPTTNKYEYQREQSYLPKYLPKNPEKYIPKSLPNVRKKAVKLGEALDSVRCEDNRFNCSKFVHWIFQERITCIGLFGFSDPAACRQRDKYLFSKELTNIVGLGGNLITFEDREFPFKRIQETVQSFLQDSYDVFLQKTHVRGENNYEINIDNLTIEDVLNNWINPSIKKKRQQQTDDSTNKTRKINLKF